MQVDQMICLSASIMRYEYMRAIRVRVSICMRCLCAFVFVCDKEYED